jgi:hypothetical protein
MRHLSHQHSSSLSRLYYAIHLHSPTKPLQHMLELYNSHAIDSNNFSGVSSSIAQCPSISLSVNVDSRGTRCKSPVFRGVMMQACAGCDRKELGDEAGLIGRGAMYVRCWQTAELPPVISMILLDEMMSSRFQPELMLLDAEGRGSSYITCWIDGALLVDGR